MVFGRKFKTIGGYEVLGKVGGGSMASVYKGRDPATGEIVAIKVVQSTSSDNPVVLRRFEREGQAVRLLNHPSIVRGYAFGHEGDLFYLIMEFVEGQDLSQRIQEKGCLTEKESLNIIIQIARGLHHAHQQGIIHRDVKPENIMLTAEGQAKLADLGMAKTFGEDFDLTRSRTGMGTPNFMAPEQFQDAKRVDVRCDVYSLGATLYMTVTGSMPFSGRWPLSILEKKINNDLIPPRELAPTLSEQTNLAVRRAVRADPNQRYPTCLDFIEALTGKNWDRRSMVRYDSRKEVECLFIEGSKQCACLARVQDVSASGIGLIFSRPFEPGTLLSIELPRIDLKPIRTLFASVVQAHEHPPAKWIVGCAFSQELNDSDLRALRG
jgi:serine/threonine protein kinase